MTPAARLQMAIDILEGLNGTAQPADRYLKDWFKARRFAGSKDRRAIAEQVFQIFRHRAGFAHRMGSETPRALAIAALLAEGGDPESLFAESLSGGYGPAPLTDSERAAIAAAPSEAPPNLPLSVQGEFPAFLESELTRAFGEKLLEEMTAFQTRAPVDLRVNTLKATRDDVLAALQADGFAAEATPRSPTGIRCPANTAPNKHPLFESGAFEIQDEAAQIASDLAGAKPGMRVLDLAAGAGGKALALAAAMQNQGEIIASDIRGPALAELEMRAARAGATIIRTHLLANPPDYSTLIGSFDIVFLDAPCSGSGTWRRQPELKWRLTPGRLSGFMATQDRLLLQAGRLTAEKGGRLIYATCSILPCENEDRVAAFLAENPQFRRLGPDFRASPAATGTDGFYAAILGQF
jgi:16S rRNA (cytosine967-C5)-methyltransferase